MGELRPTDSLLYASFDASSPAGVALLNADTFEGTFLANTGLPGGMSGLAFDSSDRLFATTLEGPSGSRSSRLVELNPDSGAVLAEIGPVTAGGNALSVGDLAAQPGTDALFALRTGEDGQSQAGRLYVLNPATGAASLVGDTGTDGTGGLAFTPNGALYTTRWNPSTVTSSVRALNPANGSMLSEVALSSLLRHLERSGLATRRWASPRYPERFHRLPPAHRSGERPEHDDRPGQLRCVQ